MTQQPALYVPQMPAENLALQVPDVGRNVDNLWRIVWRRRWRCLAAFKPRILRLISGVSFVYPYLSQNSSEIWNALNAWCC